MRIYNITGTSDPKVSSVKFVDNIPQRILKILASDISVDANGKLVYGDFRLNYDRLVSLQASGHPIDVSASATIVGVQAAVTYLGLTQTEADVLIGYTET